MGDFNLPDINWHLLTCESISNAHFSFNFLECLHDCSINRMVDSPTRIRIGRKPNSLVLSNIDDHISNVNVGPAIEWSDHSTITLNINLHPTTEDCNVKRCMYDKGNYKEVNKYLKEAINIYNSDNTDCIWHAIKTNMMKGMKNFILTIDLHCNMVKRNKPLNKEILARVKKKKRC